MNRRAAFTPLHLPRCEWRRILSRALEHLALKRNKFRAPFIKEKSNEIVVITVYTFYF